MKRLYENRYYNFIVNNSSLLLFVIIFAFFALTARNFFTVDNFLSIVKNASFIGMLAVGMTFPLLTAGIDLSVGSNMYLSTVVAGLLMRQHEIPVMLGLLIAVGVGALYGTFNGFCIVKLRIIPFMATLATLVMGRGLGTYLTDSVQVDLPERVNSFGQFRLIGIPMPVIVFMIVLAFAMYILQLHPLGRQIYAIGNDAEAATKAGINTGRVTWTAYILCGAIAGLAGFILASQVMRVDRSFGDTYELDAIAAAVIGGTSLFGGVGSAQGAVFGAILLQMVETGLVFRSVNLYLQPMVKAMVIFIAVFFDGLRTANLARLRRRFIRTDAEPEGGVVL
jgi:ribose/xylose/arabinose/galactoside ABC-type transport system permease subunit